MGSYVIPYHSPQYFNLIMNAEIGVTNGPRLHKQRGIALLKRFNSDNS